MRVASTGSPEEFQAEAFAARALRPQGLVSPGAATVPAVPDSTGVPLDPDLRRTFEAELGCGLGAVRIHADAGAHRFARDVRARAATVGSRIYFGAGQYAPRSSPGHSLLAHELVHTLQPGARGIVHRSPEDEARLVAVDRLLASTQLAEMDRDRLLQERYELLQAGNRPRGRPRRRPPRRLRPPRR